MQHAWLTDIHLEFLPDKKAVTFVKDLANQGFGGIFLTGDITTAKRLECHLQLFEDIYQAPVYFVLGNHDYYGGAIDPNGFTVWPYPQQWQITILPNMMGS